MIVLLKHASYSKIAFISILWVWSPTIFISVTISFQHGHKDQCLLLGEEIIITKADVLGWNDWLHLKVNAKDNWVKV